MFHLYNLFGQCRFTAEAYSLNFTTFYSTVQPEHYCSAVNAQCGQTAKIKWYRFVTVLFHSWPCSSEMLVLRVYVTQCSRIKVCDPDVQQKHVTLHQRSHAVGSTKSSVRQVSQPTPGFNVLHNHQNTIKGRAALVMVGFHCLCVCPTDSGELLWPSSSAWAYTNTWPAACPCEAQPSQNMLVSEPQRGCC